MSFLQQVTLRLSLFVLGATVGSLITGHNIKSTVPTVYYPVAASSSGQVRNTPESVCTYVYGWHHEKNHYDIKFFARSGTAVYETTVLQLTPEALQAVFAETKVVGCTGIQGASVIIP